MTGTLFSANNVAVAAVAGAATGGAVANAGAVTTASTGLIASAKTCLPYVIALAVLWKLKVNNFWKN